MNDDKGLPRPVMMEARSDGKGRSTSTSLEAALEIYEPDRHRSHAGRYNLDPGVVGFPLPPRPRQALPAHG